MWLKETGVSISLLGVAAALCCWTTIQRKTIERPIILFLLSFLNILFHILPLFVSFFVSISSRPRKVIKACVFFLSVCMSVGAGIIIYRDPTWSIITILLGMAYIILAVLEGVLYVIIWVSKVNRRRAMKKNPVIKRRFGNEIRLPSITVSTEARHLRTKCDFVINGVVYIRKGETVELLRTIGSYYSVRNSSGTEYIVPKANFF